MLNRKKMISLLVLIAFTLQGCSRGVTPTGPGPVDPKAPEGTLQQQISALICLNENDSDSDGDGVCDLDDVSEEGYDCSQDPNCMKEGMDDGLAKPEKSKWWLYVGGGLVLAAGASWIAKEVSGDWWWNKIGDNEEANDTNNLVKFYKQFGSASVDANATEEFFSVAGEATPHGLIKTSLSAEPGQGSFYYSLSPFDGPRIKRGAIVKTCIHGTLGVQYQGNEGAVHKAKATYYLDEDYLKTPKVEDITSQAFDTLCRSKRGYFMAYQTKEGQDQYYMTPLPSSLIKTMNAEGATAFSINYRFDSIPATVSSSSIIQYCRINPDYPNLTCDSQMTSGMTDAEKAAVQTISMRHILRFDNQTAIDAFNGSGSNQARVEKIFALTAGSEIKSEAKPAEIQEKESAIAQEIPTKDSNALCELFPESTFCN